MRRYFLIFTILPALIWGCSPKQEKEVNPAKFHVFKSHNQIHILRNDQHITTYLFDSVLLKPILYPLYSPSGIQIERHYPLTWVEGESHDHPHHTGLFFTYGTEGEVNGNNFWAGQEGLSRIQHTRVTEIKKEADKAILGISADWIGRRGETILKEDRTMEFSGNERQNIIDFIFRLTAVTEDVELKDTKEGLFAIRVADWLSETRGDGKYLSALGDTTEANVWGKPAKWVRLEAVKDGLNIGIVIMNHPSSVNYPTYWHARGYGLFSANPLGRSVFREGRGLDNPVPLNFTIPRGETALFKFRMIIYERDLSPDQIESIFKSYSK